MIKNNKIIILIFVLILATLAIKELVDIHKPTSYRLYAAKKGIPVSYFGIEFYGIQTNSFGVIRLSYPATRKNRPFADCLDMRYFICDDITQATEIRKELMVCAEKKWNEHLSQEWKPVKE